MTPQLAQEILRKTPKQYGKSGAKVKIAPPGVWLPQSFHGNGICRGRMTYRALSVQADGEEGTYDAILQGMKRSRGSIPASGGKLGRLKSALY